MRLILSRKGFDSGWGGVPSPILPDGRLLSFPIPDVDGVPYADLRADGSTSYADIMRHLGIDTVGYPGRGKLPLDEAGAHLDPDLARGTLPREAGWRAAFGQVAGAQTHLKNQKVSAGDLFLFFGWFRHTVHQGSLRYDRRSKGVHALWGYLQIGEIIDVASTALPPRGLEHHPHFVLHDQPRFAQNNTVYVAAERLTLAPSSPGAGVLGPFTPEMQLTKPGATRSVWSLPFAFHPSQTKAPMSGNSISAWDIDGDQAILRSANIGQEFVVEANDGITDWFRHILHGSEEEAL